MFVVLVVAAVLILDQPPRGQTGPTASPPTGTASAAASASASPAPTLPGPVVTAVGRSARFDPQAVREPTGSSAQSKVWFAEGAWWGLLLDAADELHIDRLDRRSMTWQDTGTLVDERPTALADALWDGSHLYVASSPPTSNRKEGLRLLRFRYDQTSGRYDLDTDYPLSLTATGVDDPLLSRDSKGVLWLVYLAPASSTAGSATPSPTASATPGATASAVANETIWSLHSTTDDLHWSAPAPAPLGTQASGVTQLAAVASGTEVALAWTDRAADEVFTARHADGAPADAWTVSGSPFDGAAGSNQGISLRTLAGDPQQRLFIGLVDALDRRPDVDQLWVRTVLLVVQPGGASRTYAFGLIQDRHVDPLLLIDPLHRRLYFLATTPGGGGTVVMKSTSIDDLVFAPGPGDPLVLSAADPSIDAPSSSKQDPTTASGILVLASDDGTGHYVEAAMSLGGPAPGGGSVAPTPTSRTASVSAPLLDDSFDPWAVGFGAPNGWALQAAAGRLRVVALPSAKDHSLQLQTTDVTARARACKSIPQVVASTLTGSATVMLGSVATGAATVFALRSGGHEEAALRFTGKGAMGYLDGGTVIDVSTGYRTGTWYRVTMTVHLSSHTYDLSVAEATSGRRVLDRQRLPLATTDATSINGVCFATSNGATSLRLNVAQVSVVRP